MKLRWDCKHSHLSLCQLDQMYVDKKPGLDIAGLTDSQRQNIQAVLVLLEQSGQTEPAQAAQSKSILTAFHLIVSALDGEENCALLSLCLQSVEYNFEVGRKNAWSLIVPSAGQLIYCVMFRCVWNNLNNSTCFTRENLELQMVCSSVDVLPSAFLHQSNSKSEWDTN